MARSKLTKFQKFLIVASSLIVIELIYIYIFDQSPKTVSLRDEIAKKVLEERDATPEQREKYKVHLALRFYYGANKKYPDSLDALVPTYFDSVPKDPETGKSFAYKLVDGKYRLGEPKKSDTKPGSPDAAPGGELLLAGLIEDGSDRASFVYDPTGKRDPFKPFDFSAPAAAVDPNNPLVSYTVGQLRLASVLQGTDEPIAIVENSAGRGFTVRKGTKIGPNGGEVVAIEKTKIVIVEQMTDFTGAKKTQTFEMELRSKGEEKRE